MKLIFAALIIQITFFCNLNAQSTYLNPLPDSKYNSPATTITIRTDDSELYSMISENKTVLVGTKSGQHGAEIIRASSKGTIIIKPFHPFDEFEHVTVSIPGKLHFCFETSVFQKIQMNAISNLQKNHKSIMDTANVPVDFPAFHMDITGNIYDGKIFFNNLPTTSPENSYLGIINSSGEVEFNKLVNNFSGMSFFLMENGLPVYWNSYLPGFICMDSTLTDTDTIMAANGYNTDFHDIAVFSNGHYLVMAKDLQPVDMSQIVLGGNPNAQVEGLILQELDEDNNVVFQWRSWDHFEITDATYTSDLTGTLIPYVHGNALCIDNDGNILLSCRHMDEITKIDRSTGETIWRLGGKNNQFQFIDDTIGFCFQHDIRRIKNGNILMFNNGGCKFRTISRVHEYQLDETAKTAKLVWSYQHPLEIYCSKMGSAQRLPNGNTFINWAYQNVAGAPDFTEADSLGNIVMEFYFDFKHYTYRSEKHLWNATADTSAIAEIKPQNRFVKCFPNPASDFVMVYSEEQIKSISIHDITGSIFRIPLDKIDNRNYRADISGLASGMYFIQVRTENGITPVRIIKD